MEEKDTLLTVDEFATKIKEKYPEYKDVDNLTLANKIVEKYPEYKSKVSFEGTPEVKKKIRHNQSRISRFRLKRLQLRKVLYSVLEVFRKDLHHLLQLV